MLTGAKNEHAISIEQKFVKKKKEKEKTQMQIQPLYLNALSGELHYITSLKISHLSYVYRATIEIKITSSEMYFGLSLIQGPRTSLHLIQQ